MHHKLLNVPMTIWILQFAYVIVALGILVIILKTRTNSDFHWRQFVVWYVLGVLVVDIIWRLIASKYIK